jgi:exopolysaccharide biosynthesis protein
MLILLLLLGLLPPGVTYKLLKRPGPLRIHVLDVAPEWRSHLKPALATDEVREVEPLLSLARRRGALAAINGGYFVVYPDQGIPGDPAGLSVIDGQLISESVGARGCLILSPEVGIAPVSSSLNLVAEDGARRRLNGRNRSLDLIRSGQAHDVTQHTQDEIVEYLPVFGPQTPGQGSLEAVIQGGTVTALRAPGGPIPSDGSVLAADAEARTWLEQHCGPGTHPRVDWSLSQPARSLIAGGPILLHQGRIDLHPASEGFAPKFYARRHPRTLVGIKPNGHLLLVVVDGHNPRLSRGQTLRESAELLKALGCSEGLNLDGGGSSTMVIGDQVVNLPSDPTGPRSIGDGLLLMP